jgi:hypothetical protein
LKYTHELVTTSNNDKPSNAPFVLLTVFFPHLTPTGLMSNFLFFLFSFFFSVSCEV